MKLYFIRHGESEANVQHVISNLESPYELTETGKQQAQALAKSLRDIQLTAIYSSPVLRARQTADIVSQSFNVTYQITEALREYDCGNLEGKSDDISWMLHRKYSNDWILHNAPLSKPEGGENFVDIQNRFLPFIESLKQSMSEHTLLIGHSGLFQLMLPLVLTNIDHDFVSSHGMGHTECVIAKLQTDSFTCLQWGDVKF